MASFIRLRGVGEESLPLIEELAGISKNTLINGMHNFFSLTPEARAEKALERSAENAATEEARRMYGLFLEFLRKNDAYAARHLVAVLERR